MPWLKQVVEIEAARRITWALAPHFGHLIGGRKICPLGKNVRYATAPLLPFASGSAQRLSATDAWCQLVGDIR
jgi:hypothetical protein